MAPRPSRSRPPPGSELRRSTRVFNQTLAPPEPVRRETRKKPESKAPPKPRNRTPSKGAAKPRNRTPSKGAPKPRNRTPSKGAPKPRNRTPSKAPSKPRNRTPSKAPPRSRNRTPSKGAPKPRNRTPSKVPPKPRDRTPSKAPPKPRDRTPSKAPPKPRDRTPSKGAPKRQRKTPSQEPPKRQKKTQASGGVDLQEDEVQEMQGGNEVQEMQEGDEDQEMQEEDEGQEMQEEYEGQEMQEVDDGQEMQEVDEGQEMQEEEEDEDEDEVELLATRKLQQLFSSTCKLYHASPLFNFDDTSKSVLDAYSNLVSNALKTNLPPAQREPYHFRVDFTRLDELRRNPQEAHSILIEVIRTRKSPLRRRKETVVFMGLFTSYNASMVKGKVMQNYRRGTYFPLFICNASTRDVLRVVHDKLDNMFMCTFVDFSWNWHAMTYMIGAWIVSNGVAPGDNFKVDCTTTSPYGCVFESELKYDLDSSYNLWRVFEAEMETAENAQDRDNYIKRFWNEIIANLRKLNGMSLTYMGLTKISLPNLVISAPGKVKATIDDLSAGQKLLMDLTRVSQDFAGKGGEDFGRLRMIR